MTREGGGETRSLKLLVNSEIGGLSFIRMKGADC